MLQRTLLERIRHPEPAGQRRSRVSPAELQDSILHNLQDILNTTQGNCLIDPDYGLPHLTSVRSAMPDSIRGFEAAIATALERHEPRLSHMRVRHAPHREDGLELRFEISGLVVDEQSNLSMRFETYADEEGRLIVT